MAKTPAISIITPVWNGLPYIKETVDSVLAQEFQDWEMIVSDNASTDGTSEYLASLKDPRIKVYRHEQNRGVYRNIQFCFTKCTAPIFMGLCADDYFFPGALQSIVSAWENVNYKPGFITFNWKKRQINHDPLMRYSYEVLPSSLTGVDSTIAYFLFGNIPGNLSEISGRVDVVQNEHYLYNIKFSADYEFWMRLSKKEGIVFDDRDVVYIRRHDRVAATYMLTNGEYHEESIGIYENLINDLSSSYNRKKLVDFYNVVICGFHLRSAMKAAWHGKFKPLKSFLALRSPIFWPTGFHFLGCLPFAASNGLRNWTSIQLAKTILGSRGLESAQHGRPATLTGQTSIHV